MEIQKDQQGKWLDRSTVVILRRFLQQKMQTQDLAEA